MWVGDNCHTYDRHNFDAQMQCGIGNNYDVLDTVIQTTFNLTYFPYIVTDENFECISGLVYNSYLNMRLRTNAVKIATSMALFSLSTLVLL